MKQKFNVGVAIKYGVRSAVIIEIMIDFFRSAAKSEEYKFDNKIYIPYSEISGLVPYMNKTQIAAALRNLINNNVIQSFNSPFTGQRYTFTDYAKEQFSKKPIRIHIYWQ